GLGNLVIVSSPYPGQVEKMSLVQGISRFPYPVAENFYTNGYCVADFWVMGLEKINGSDEYRKTIEQLWKRKLRTFKPYGLNTKD
ncbi:hypothetical protein DPMN_052422, partial [Dreissena polymorpha]